MAGVAINESKTETQSAPVTAMAIGLSISAPEPIPYASGNMPSAAARDVINTGRSRRLD